jgi:hypothetical protein
MGSACACQVGLGHNVSARWLWDSGWTVYATDMTPWAAARWCVSSQRRDMDGASEHPKERRTVATARLQALGVELTLISLGHRTRARVSRSVCPRQTLPRNETPDLVHIWRRFDPE